MIEEPAGHPAAGTPEQHGHAAAGHDEHGMAGQGGHGDDHHDPHMDDTLGPVDWFAWGAATLGVGVAGFVALLMALVLRSA
ncbi:MAG: hypothetical protein ACRDF7_06705 [Candidatus Limnocylindrales bacterium]